MTNIENTEKKEIPQIIQLVNTNDLDGVKQLLLSGEAKVEDVDDSGMTPLQHACYKGQISMTKLLLEYGADVNSNNHSHNYSCLHFAALSGILEVVQVILSAGARAYHTNSLKRTASQMAGFVGNHQIVALINNFIPEDDVFYYTKIQGLEKEPKLPKIVAKHLHSIIMQSNLHPVYVTLSVERSPMLLAGDHLQKATQVLRLMCEKEAKRAANVNEVICLKLHFLSYILDTLWKSSEKSNETDSKEGLRFEPLLKKWLIGRNSDGFEQHLDAFVRSAVKGFPFVELPLFLQLCRNMAGPSDQMWALDSISAAINGQRAFNDNKTCTSCGAENDAAKRCAKCKSAQYCDRTCQRLQWHTHKKFCPKLALKNQQREQEEEPLDADKHLLDKIQSLAT